MREHRVDGVLVNRCLIRVITNQSRFYLTAYSQYKAGFLPEACWLDCNGKFIEAMSYISGLIESAQKEERNG